MWSEPVTFGGGIMMQKVSGRDALAPALKAPASSQARVKPGLGLGSVKGFFHRHPARPCIGLSFAPPSTQCGPRGQALLPLSHWHKYPRGEPSQKVWGADSPPALAV